MKGAVIVGPNEGQSLWQPAPAGGYVTIKLSASNMRYEAYAAGIQVLPAGCNVREHGHARNHELIFVFEGDGTVTVDDECAPIEPGTTVLFEPGSYHRIDNTGKTDMKLFWVYSPPGLDRWFSGIGKPRIAGEAAPAPFERAAQTNSLLDALAFLPPRAR